MPRRKKDEDWFELFVWLFTRYSAWLCVPAAVVAFVAIKGIIVMLASTLPLLRGFVPLGSMFGGLAAFVALIAGAKAGIEKLRRRKLFDQQSGIESVRELSWSEFEMLIGEAYRRQGYEVTETGGGGADGGIDLKLKKSAETVLVQCKQWKVFKVGVKPIREMYGVLMASGADRAVFVTSGVYTEEAREFARGKSVELMDGESLSTLVSSVPKTAGSLPLEPTRMLTESAAACPLCNRSMVLRTARKGANAGSQFWGCSAYPRCRGTRPST